MVAALVLLAVPAYADPKLEVSTAAPGDAWRNGRSSPFVVKLTGVANPRAAIRVDCHGTENSYVRAHDVRIGVATPAVSDFPVRAIPKAEEVGCTAYEGDHWIASWRGTLAWPSTTLPDHRIAKLAASQCDSGWCVDVTLDRSHPGVVGADVEVMCTLRHASTEKLFVEHAPSKRTAVTTTKDHVRLSLGDPPGATVIACTVDRGLYGNARFVDLDPTNNETSTVVTGAPSRPARLALVGAVSAKVQDGCAHCCSHVPGEVNLTLRIKNQGPDVTGIGVRCEVSAGGTVFHLLGTGNATATGADQLAVVSIPSNDDVLMKLVGKLKTRCEAIVWDQPAMKPVRWTGTVTFPKQ